MEVHGESSLSIPFKVVLETLILYSHGVVFFNGRRMLLGQCMDGIDSLCGSFDNETSAKVVSIFIISSPKA